MTQLNQQLSAAISLRLKELRGQRAWSLDKTAKHTGVSKAMLGQIERGESSPTIATLWKIASGLEASFSSFFAASPDGKSPMAEGFQKDPKMKVKTLFPYTAEANMEVFEITLLDQHFQQSSAHQTGVIEHIQVLMGELEIVVGDHFQYLQPGDCYRFMANQQHSYRALSAQVVFQDIITYPAGPLLAQTD